MPEIQDRAMPQFKILIVGAGPTGLVLALHLARHGIAFRIIDQASGPGQASRAMAVQARTLEFYRQLGFADELVELGIKMERLHLREGGQDVANLALRDLGGGLSPYPFMLCFPQDDHEHFLVKKLQAADVKVEWGVALKQFTQDEAGVHAILDSNGTLESCDFAYLCGCDGAHSRVRQGLQLAFPGGTYDQLFYVADVKVARSTGNEMYVNLSQDGFVLMLPVRSSGMKRLIGLVPKALSNQASLAFEDIRASTEAILGIKVTQVNWFSTYHVHHRVAERFSDGRCFIAGDAAHIHSPAGGQGMNTGIGDAVNLSWKLAHVLAGRADPAILATYETERIAFARTLVATTDRAFQGMAGAGRGSQFLRTWLVPHLMPFLTGFSAVRHMIFKRVSQVSISYHASALSAGKAGQVHGGDRLPWVDAPEGDNFAPLQSLDWHLQIYGQADRGLLETAAALRLPVHVFVWGNAADAAGMQCDAAYLVRPDGHVALVQSEQSALRLRDFVQKLGLKFSGRA